MIKDKIVMHIDNVPVYKDADFMNNYVKIEDWFKEFKDVYTCKHIVDEIIEDFEEWCFYNEVTSVNTI